MCCNTAQPLIFSSFETALLRPCRAVQGAQAAHQQRQRDNSVTPSRQLAPSETNAGAAAASQSSSIGQWKNQRKGQHHTSAVAGRETSNAAGTANQQWRKAEASPVSRQPSGLYGSQLASNGSQAAQSLPWQSQPQKAEDVQAQGRQSNTWGPAAGMRAIRVPHRQQAQAVAQTLLRQRQSQAGPAVGEARDSAPREGPAVPAEPAGGTSAEAPQAQLLGKPSARKQGPAVGQRVTREAIQAMRELKVVPEGDQGSACTPPVPRRRSISQAAQIEKQPDQAAAQPLHLSSGPHVDSSKGDVNGNQQTSVVGETVDPLASSKREARQNERRQEQAVAQGQEARSTPKTAEAQSAVPKVSQVADSQDGAARLKTSLENILASASQQKPDTSVEQFKAHTVSELKNMRIVHELRPLCQKYGLSSSGLKDVLILRILAHEAGLFVSMGL